MPKAFIVGLPRTRSAWLTDVINSHNLPTRASHEGLREILQVKEDSWDYPEYLRECYTILYSDRVDCSSAPYITERDLKDRVPVVIIERSALEVVNSLKSLALFKVIPESSLREAAAVLVLRLASLKARLEKIEDYPLLVVDYKDLRSSTVVGLVLSHIGIDPDYRLIDCKQSYNIQAQYLQTTTPEEFSALGKQINKLLEGSVLFPRQETEDATTTLNTPTTNGDSHEENY